MRKMTAVREFGGTGPPALVLAFEVNSNDDRD